MSYVMPNAKYSVGDRIYIEGYADKSFEIYAIHIDYYRDSGKEFYEIYYDCYCEQDGEYYFADESDISLIKSRAGGGFKKEAEDIENIDDLLTELNDVMTLIEMFGEHEDKEKRDRRYILRKNEIEAKLIELTQKQNEGEIPS